MNPRLKQLMKELEEAISGSLAKSDRVAHVITKINGEGFDIFLMLEATAGLSRLQNAASSRELVGTHRKNPESQFMISANDARFLKSLRISVDDAP